MTNTFKKRFISTILFCLICAILSGCFGAGQSITVTNKKTGGSITITDDTVLVDGMVIDDGQTSVKIESQATIKAKEKAKAEAIKKAEERAKLKAEAEAKKAE